MSYESAKARLDALERSHCDAPDPMACEVEHGWVTAKAAMDDHAPTDLAAALKVIEAVRPFLEHWRGMGSSFEADDAYTCPMARDVEYAIRDAVAEFEALP